MCFRKGKKQVPEPRCPIHGVPAIVLRGDDGESYCGMAVNPVYMCLRCKRVVPPVEFSPSRDPRYDGTHQCGGHVVFIANACWQKLI